MDGSNTFNNTPLNPNEKCTLKCTGIPSYVNEIELVNHFRSFGKLVFTQYNAAATSSSSVVNDEEEEGVEGNKTATATNSVGGNDNVRKYGEYYVQYSLVEDAKKCFTSAKAVLNNRFIKLYFHNVNMIPKAVFREGDEEEQESSEPVVAGASGRRRSTLSGCALWGWGKVNADTQRAIAATVYRALQEYSHRVFSAERLGPGEGLA